MRKELSDQEHGCPAYLGGACRGTTVPLHPPAPAFGVWGPCPIHLSLGIERCIFKMRRESGASPPAPPKTEELVSRRKKKKRKK